MAAQLYKTESGRLFHAGAVAIITVGLPARGKTHVSRSLCRYLRWLGVATRVFSVGNYRRERMGSIPNDWFDPSNLEALKVREGIADECLDDMIEWLAHGGGQLGIYDGNNVTEERRREIHEKLIARDIHPLFIESICNKPEIVYANIRSVKISSPDYVGWDPEEAVKDYTHRIERHMENYETIADTSLPFVKLLNVGEKITVNRVAGYLQSRIVYYLMNLHVRPRKIYFARTGKALNDLSYKGDAELSEEGHQYAQQLKSFLLAYRLQQTTASGTPEEQERPLTVWTSTRKKARQTAEPFASEGIPVRQHSVLTQLNPGEADGLTRTELKEKFPEEVVRARQDPYRHRYPRAESYHDLAVRLEAVIMELEREKNDVLIIAHETVLKCLYAYLFDRPESEIPTISIPRNFLIEITPSAYGCKEARMQLDL
ncbi:6-phosphofructo-2-kinase-domain-containing protein [Syncephalastrum racemosum]|uniref:6-phosphofructo-2-kinase-domain-containing protein n=1 Tax=Syncephalastrum racemosum TaxID=13706 RepID=A0A1X2H819_SYNRA|nr:6-phosphofructo-2-kinase-domain-containing protein [Syncephalastrum racemosum]